MCGALIFALLRCLRGYPGWLPILARSPVGSLSSALVTRGHTINRARKTVIWLGAVLVAFAVIPAYYTASSALALALICFGLFAIQVKGSVFFTLPTRSFPGGTGWRRSGVCLARWEVWAGASWVCWAGYLIQEAGYESVFLMIACLHLISALLLQIFVPRIAMVTQ